jgi:hypothetical protein
MTHEKLKAPENIAGKVELATQRSGSWSKPAGTNAPTETAPAPATLRPEAARDQPVTLAERCAIVIFFIKLQLAGLVYLE